MSVDNNLSLDHQLCVALYKASRAVNSCYRPLLDDLDLTYSQYTVLLVLWESPSTTLGDLARLLHLDSGTLSPLLKRMEQNGVLTRTRSIDDERVLLVDLTAKGLALENPASEAQRSVEDATGLSSAELANLRDELNVLTDRMRSDTAMAR